MEENWLSSEVLTLKSHLPFDNGSQPNWQRAALVAATETATPLRKKYHVALEVMTATAPTTDYAKIKNLNLIGSSGKIIGPPAFLLSVHFCVVIRMKRARNYRICAALTKTSANSCKSSILCLLQRTPKRSYNRKIVVIAQVSIFQMLFPSALPSTLLSSRLNGKMCKLIVLHAP